MKQLIENVHILTMDDKKTEYRNGYLLINNTVIEAMGEMSESLPYADEKIDGQGGILIPGMINTHTHAGMIPFRSLGDDVPDRLRRFLFPLEEGMNKELVRASSFYAMAEMLLAGITTFADMYYFEDEVAKVAEAMQMRAFVGQTIIDMPVCDYPTADEALEGTEIFINHWKNHELITPMIAPHATNTNTKKTLVKVAQLGQKYQVPIMMHVAEMTYEMDYFKETYQQTPVEFLESIHAFHSHFILVHGIFLEERDQRILESNQEQVKMAHCIGANTKSAKGVAPIHSLLQKKIDIGLGTDGPSSGNTLELFTQMRMVANFHKTREANRSIFPAKEIVELATLGGAKVLKIDQKVGSLEVGKKADIVLVETHSVNMFPVFDPYAVLVYSANASNVQNVWINGRLLVKNKQLTEVSLPVIRENLEKAMREFRHRAEELSGNK